MSLEGTLGSNISSSSIDGVVDRREGDGEWFTGVVDRSLLWVGVDLFGVVGVGVFERMLGGGGAGLFLVALGGVVVVEPLTLVVLDDRV